MAMQFILISEWQWMVWLVQEITRHAMIICDQRPPGAHKEEPL